MPKESKPTFFVYQHQATRRRYKKIHLVGEIEEEIKFCKYMERNVREMYKGYWQRRRYYLQSKLVPKMGQQLTLF